MKIGKNLKKFIKSRGLNQTQFAELVGVRQSDVSEWVNDLRMPRPETISKITELLNISTADLVEEDERVAHFDDMTGWVKLRVIGKVPAGVPIEAVEEYVSEIVVPPEHARPGCYALEVRGNSMVPKIMDGDVVVVAPCPDPRSGQIVVTRINSDGEVTLKKFQKDNGAILLVPENPEYQTRILTPDSNIKILGCVIALHRRF
jgi:repressor LexA